jgi:hypothetical protein
VTLGENPNYEVTTADGTFTITAKPITVTAIAASKVYGEADPETLSYTVEGLVGNDTLGGALRFVAEYALRNDEPGACELREAIDRYELIAERIESAMGGE